MTETIARQPQGIPVGGQFAPTFHAEPAVALRGSSGISVPFQGSIDLNESSFAPLPELPSAAGAPDVSFDFSDAGILETHVTSGGTTVSFWGDHMADTITNSVDNGYIPEGEDAPWSHLSGGDFEKLRTWGESVHERIDGATYRLVADASCTKETGKQIISFATGRTGPAVKPTPQQESARRAAVAMAVCEEGQGSQDTLRDLFTDLRHHADAKGIDFYQALEDSLGYYQHEKTDPTFKEGY